MLNLAGGIASRGYAVDLVLAKAEGPYLSQVPGSVRLVDLKASRTLTSLLALVRYLRQERPDAMISALSRANIIALWGRRLAGVPERLVINEQNTLSQWAQQSSNWCNRLTPQLASYFYRWATAVVAVSQGVADDLIQAWRIPRELVKVIYNPGVTPELREKAQLPLAHPWFQDDRTPVLVGVGSLTAQKDFGTLLHAFAQVRRNRPVRLFILGEGSDRPMLEGLVRKLGLEHDVSLPGFVENPYAYMARASAFVLSSRWEGLPTVLVEALYAGTSLIATDCPSGPREILRDGKFGVLVRVGKADELAQAIARTLDGQVPRAPIESWQPFTLETVVDKYIRLLFESVIPVCS